LWRQYTGQLYFFPAGAEDCQAIPQAVVFTTAIRINEKPGFVYVDVLRYLVDSRWHPRTDFHLAPKPHFAIRASNDGVSVSRSSTSLDTIRDVVRRRRIHLAKDWHQRRPNAVSTAVEQSVTAGIPLAGSRTDGICLRTRRNQDETEALVQRRLRGVRLRSAQNIMRILQNEVRVARCPEMNRTVRKLERDRPVKKSAHYRTM
jgi:hypothetical protein